MKNVSFMRNGKEFKPTRTELERVLDDYAERLALIEKALELACLELSHFKCFCSDHQCIHYGKKECWSENYSEENCSKVMGNDFKTKAKEMMKSE